MKSKSTLTAEFRAALVAVLRRYPDWPYAAACGSRPSDRHFPETRRKSLIQPVQQTCRGCPVVQQCGAHALLHGIPHGIWGALEKSTRDKIRERSDPDEIRRLFPAPVRRFVA